MLDFVDETFDQISLAIQPLVVFTLRFRASMWWNDWFSAIFNIPIKEFLSCIAAIGNKMFKCEPINQFYSLCDIVTVACRQPQPQWIAEAVNCDMDLGAKSTSTTSQRLVCLTTVFLCPCGTWMSTNNRAINHSVFHIRVISEVQKQAFPHTIVTPTGKTLVNGVPSAIASKLSCNKLAKLPIELQELPFRCKCCSP